MTEPDRIAEMFGSLTEQSPGVYTSPVGLNADELGTMAKRMVAQANLAKNSPAAALASQMMTSGEDPLDFLRNRDIPFNEEELDPEDVARWRDATPEQRQAGAAFIDKALQNPDPNFPERPDHPDFRMLSRIIQGMDAVADQNSALPEGDRDVVESLMPFGVDPETVIYMAKQRAHRAEDLLSEEGSFYAKAVIMWLDAFTAGVKFGREQAVRTALDNSIENGSHRSGGLR